MKKIQNQKGFTLVELAIVMVIIGLLVGAVLKGQAMIDDARGKRFINDMQGISAGYFTYYDRYSAYPGDDNATVARWGLANGNNGGTINTAAEQTAAWQGLRYAELVAGNPATAGAAAQPRNPYSGVYGFAGGAVAGLGNRNYITATNVPGEVAESFDIKFDDGVWDTGSVRGNAVYTTATVTVQYVM